MEGDHGTGSLRLGQFGKLRKKMCLTICCCASSAPIFRRSSSLNSRSVQSYFARCIPS